jgi:hypothetical protein
MNDTTAAIKSVEELERRLEGMIVTIEMFKKHGQIVPPEVLKLVDLVGVGMLHSLIKDMGWSPMEAVLNLTAMKRELEQEARRDPMDMIADLLGGVMVEDKRGPQVQVHTLEGDELDKFKAAVRTGNAQAIDDFIRSKIEGIRKADQPKDEGNGKPAADTPAQGS